MVAGDSLTVAHIETLTPDSAQNPRSCRSVALQVLLAIETEAGKQGLDSASAAEMAKELTRRTGVQWPPEAAATAVRVRADRFRRYASIDT